MATRSIQMRNASSLAERVFSLDEPWRSRFLDLIEDRMRGTDRQVEDIGSSLDRASVESWLEDQKHYRQVYQLLRTWMHVKS